MGIFAFGAAVDMLSEAGAGRIWEKNLKFQVSRHPVRAVKSECPKKKQHKP